MVTIFNRARGTDESRAGERKKGLSRRDVLKRGGAASLGALLVISGNAGCTLQIQSQLRAAGHNIEVLHPVELLDRAYSSGLRKGP